jgi:hypothetical protein
VLDLVVSNEVYVVIEGIAALGRERIEVVGKAIKAFYHGVSTSDDNI